MTTTERYSNERLDHLGIVAGVCQEIDLAAWLDAQDSGNRKPRECVNSDSRYYSERLWQKPPAIVSGATVLREQTDRATARVLGSVPRCKSVDCLGRTLDWLYAHDPTKLFAGIASQARQVFGISARQVHVDTTSFSVSGAYNSAGERVLAATRQRRGRPKARCSRSRMAIRVIIERNAPQWMIALATTHDGDVPLFLQPLDGNSSGKISLLAAVIAIQKQLRGASGEQGIYVADSGIYSEANMRQLNAAGVTWVSRVPETLQEAKAVLQAGSEQTCTTSFTMVLRLESVHRPILALLGPLYETLYL